MNSVNVVSTSPVGPSITLRMQVSRKAIERE
jgi:hypothetical protein